MKRILSTPLYFLFFLSLLLSIISCKKSDTSNPSNSFNFVYDGNTYTSNHDTATQYSPEIVLEAYIPNCPIHDVNFQLTSSNVGQYDLITGSGNSTLYVDNLGNPLNKISGSVNITANTNNRLSGNFNVIVKDMSNVTHITSGNFIDMPIVP